MFESPQKPNCTWTFKPGGRGCRSVETNVGVYVIEHEPTGKLIVGYSRRVSHDVDQQIAALAAGRHVNKHMNKLASMDMELKLYEYDIPMVQFAKDATRKIKRSVVHPFLLLNP